METNKKISSCQVVADERERIFSDPRSTRLVSSDAPINKLHSPRIWKQMSPPSLARCYWCWKFGKPLLALCWICLRRRIYRQNRVLVHLASRLLPRGGPRFFPTWPAYYRHDANCSHFCPSYRRCLRLSNHRIIEKWHRYRVVNEPKKNSPVISWASNPILMNNSTTLSSSLVNRFSTGKATTSVLSAARKFLPYLASTNLAVPSTWPPSFYTSALLSSPE